MIPRAAVLCILCSALCATLPAAPDGGALFAEGQRAFMAGDLALARARFEGVLAEQPGHSGARNYLRMISAQERQKREAGGVEGRIAAIILPQVRFKDATLDSVIEYLRQQAAAAAPGGAGGPINFVVELPGEKLSTPVTLSLQNVPLAEVLRYVGNLAGVQFVAEQHAVVVRPAGAPAR